MSCEGWRVVVLVGCVTSIHLYHYLLLVLHLFPPLFGCGSVHATPPHCSLLAWSASTRATIHTHTHTHTCFGLHNNTLVWLFIHARRLLTPVCLFSSSANVWGPIHSRIFMYLLIRIELHSFCLTILMNILALLIYVADICPQV